MSAIERMDRLLLLLPKLQPGTPLKLSDLAAELGTDARTVMADIEVLVKRDHPEPAGFMEAITVAVENDTVTIDRAGHFRRPMALTREEASALDLAIAIVRQEVPSDEVEQLDDARARLRFISLDASATDSAAVAVRVGSTERQAAAFHAALTECIAKAQLTVIAYQRPNDSAPSPREVAPMGLGCVRGIWYLYALNGAGGELRQFRLDRIHGVDPTELAFEPPPDFDLERVLRDGRPFIGDVPARVRIRYRGSSARWVAEEEGLTLDGDGTLTVEYPLADPDWAVRQALGHGVNAEILGPAAVRARLVERLAAIAAIGIRDPDSKEL